MKTSESKTTSNLASQQLKQQPFFRRGGDGFLTSEAQPDVQPFFAPRGPNAKPSFFNPPGIQTKPASSGTRFTAGRAGNKYEQAIFGDKQGGMQSSQALAVQTKCTECKEEEKLQKREKDEVGIQEMPQQKVVFDANSEPPDDTPGADERNRNQPHLLADELTPVQQGENNIQRVVTEDPAACPSYEPDEIARSKTSAGVLDPDVDLHAPGELLIADFGNNWGSVKGSTRAEALLVEWLSRFEGDPSYRLEITGYSDCAGENTNNAALRRRRAWKVEQLLGPSALSRVMFRGMGRLGEFVVDNSSSSNRAKNRSVTIRFHQEFNFSEEETQEGSPIPEEGTTPGLETGQAPETSGEGEECPTYESGERNRSRTGAGILTPDVSLHAPGELLISDFGNNWAGVKASTQGEALLQEWLARFNSDSSYRMEVMGYTDCAGRDQLNAGLRRRRARSVEGLLASGARSRVLFRGMAPLGEFVVSDNSSPDNRAKNRSVIIRFHQEFNFPGDTVPGRPPDGRGERPGGGDDRDRGSRRVPSEPREAPDRGSQPPSGPDAGPVCGDIDDFLRNALLIDPSLTNDIVTCACFAGGILDALPPIGILESIGDNPIVEAIDCLCNIYTFAQEVYKRGTPDNKGGGCFEWGNLLEWNDAVELSILGGVTALDCSSAPLSGAISNFIAALFAGSGGAAGGGAGSAGGPPGAVGGAVGGAAAAAAAGKILGEAIGWFVADVIPMLVQNYITQDTVLPLNQIDACSRLIDLILEEAARQGEAPSDHNPEEEPQLPAPEDCPESATWYKAGEQVDGRQSRENVDFTSASNYRTYIKRIYINISDLSAGMRLEWENPCNLPVPRGPFQFNPGAGLCCLDCNDEHTSQQDDTLCTPKGTWIVDGKAPVLPGPATWARNATYFFRSRGVAIHAGDGRLFSEPASHGCIRTTTEASEIIHDNTIFSTRFGDRRSQVIVYGTWSGPNCYPDANPSTRRQPRDRACPEGNQVISNDQAAANADAQDGPGPED